MESTISKGGRLLTPGASRGELSKDKTANVGNWWSSSQYNATNAWNLNNGSLNNNNKNNGNSVARFFELYDICTNLLR